MFTYPTSSSTPHSERVAAEAATAALAVPEAAAAAAAANDACQQMLPHEEFPLLLRLIHLNTHSAMKEPIF
ncbi:hypothetical protein E2C01_004322 [Portunus trituberculatus]|uniref:Uncharacterized protein n=1 Tax=Portunus trituberculatus TaxID=210409 RepID=A0A5B7CS37_PORTR|nr:hypothetical protein [Portunus trituberculatus]